MLADRCDAALASGAAGQNWFRRLFDQPAYVVAPMVDQSEHTFRVLCRRHGATLAYTPMFSSRQWVESEQYRRTIFGPTEGSVEADDRPLVVQFAGNDPEVLLAAAKHVQHRCNAVDVNFGCPQKIAKRGRYGAWLLHEPELMEQLVGTLHCHLECPVTAKIRVCQQDGFKSKRASLSETIDRARSLVGAGASVIALHGRTREQKGSEQGAADWEAIAALAQAVSVPVLANGGVSSLDEARACLASTGADGVMAAEGLLSNPALFDSAAGPSGSAQEALALEYLDLQGTHPPAELRAVKQHLFSMCYAGLQVHTDLRERMHLARSLTQMREVVSELEGRPRASRPPFSTEVGPRHTGWYGRHTWELERAALKKAERCGEARAEAEAAPAAAQIAAAQPQDGVDAMAASGRATPPEEGREESS